MRRIDSRYLRLIVLAGMLAVATSSQGQTLTYDHDGEALFSIDYPPGWLVDLDFEQEAEEADVPPDEALRIIEARPNEDQHLWVGIWVVPDATTLDEGAAYTGSLNQDLFTVLDVGEPQRAEANGMSTLQIGGTAEREGEAVQFRAVLFEPRSGVIAAALCVGSLEAWKAHQVDIEAIATSIVPVR